MTSTAYRWWTCRLWGYGFFPPWADQLESRGVKLGPVSIARWIDGTWGIYVLQGRVWQWESYIKEFRP